jgi:hypothetical protein
VQGITAGRAIGVRHPKIDRPIGPETIPKCDGTHRVAGVGRVDAHPLRDRRQRQRDTKARRRLERVELGQDVWECGAAETHQERPRGRCAFAAGGEHGERTFGALGEIDWMVVEEARQVEKA